MPISTVQGSDSDYLCYNTLANAKSIKFGSLNAKNNKKNNKKKKNKKNKNKKERKKETNKERKKQTNKQKYSNQSINLTSAERIAK